VVTTELKTGSLAAAGQLADTFDNDAAALRYYAGGT
jgi:hypothetical protein